MMSDNDAATKGERPDGDGAPAGLDAAAPAETMTTLAFDIDEQPMASMSAQRFTERTDLPIIGLPRPAPRRLPLFARLRLLWHRQILRDARH
jgi:hypothetical protein